MMKWMVKAATAATLAIAAGGAYAQQCEEFGDVLQSDTLVCNAVEWVKNRSVTLGCGDGSNYCPNDSVTRAQMAIFMQRLGTPLTPELLAVQGGIDTPTVLPAEGTPAVTLCVSPTLAPADYPRKVLINTMVSVQATAASATFRVFNLVTANGAAPTQPTMNSVAARGTAPVNGWDSVSLTEVMNLAPDTSYVFFVGVRPDQISGLGGTAERIRCQLTATVMNRNGTASPL